MNYQLNTEAAKAADVMFARIEQRGKYLGVLTRAEPITSIKGTKGVDLSFKAQSGETADYLTIWTHNGDGKQLQGFNTLMALMTCLRVKSLNAETGEIEKYNTETKQREKVKTPLFTELMNKPVGFLLHMEEYKKRSGESGWKPSISAIFDDSEFTASEILGKKTAPELLAKMVAQLKDKPLSNKDTGNTSPSSHADDPFDSLPNDCPF